jgi:hypothetical protein
MHELIFCRIIHNPNEKGVKFKTGKAESRCMGVDPLGCIIIKKGINMQTLLGPLLKQFALLDHPIRFLIYRFLIGLGAIRLISDLSMTFFDKAFLKGVKVTVLFLLLSTIAFVLEYFEQKKLKHISTQTNVT